jgi:hypothetical protein
MLKPETALCKHDVAFFSDTAWLQSRSGIGCPREVEMSKEPMTSAVWDTTIRRYIIVSAVGLIVALYFFYRLYIMPVSEAVPMWIVVGASLGGLVTSSGVFGLAITLFFRLMGKH